MPKVMELFGYYVYFWSNEGFPLEPVHVHISRNPHKNATKVWILSDGSALLCNNNDGIPPKNLKRILKTISLFSEEILYSWEKHSKKSLFMNQERNKKIQNIQSNKVCLIVVPNRLAVF